MPKHLGKTTQFYRPRNPVVSPFYKIVRDHFNEFEAVYPQRYELRFGFWRPVIREAVDKFLECGDPHYGFARVRCPECGEQFFVAFSCKQRGACPSCDQKRSLILGHRLLEEVLAPVPHLQWVFTIPKRLRVYFRFTRSLLGELCKAAYETVREVMLLELDTEGCVPGMIGAVQTFGSITNWHPHVHTITAEGVFDPEGNFVPVPHIRLDRALEIWRDKVFDIFFDAGLLDLETIGSMMMWKHSGFNIDSSVRIEADDRAGMQRLIEYISRCPFSLARMIKITDDGKVLYRANNPDCTRYPELGMELSLSAGMSRNYQVFDPLDFLASVTQHIPNKGDHQIRYYGYYSNKSRGMRKGKAECISPDDPESLTEFQVKQRLTWSTLIKCVYEVDPLECPNCGAQMKIVGFIERDNAILIKLLLSVAGLWREPAPRPPPPEPAVEPEAHDLVLDYSFFDQNCI